MPFEGFHRQKDTPTPFEAMAEERRQEELDKAEDAEIIEEELPEDGNLNLEKISHLGMFLESAEDIYADAAQYEAQAMAENYKSLDVITDGGDEVQGREVFETLYDKLQEFQQKIDSVRYDSAPESGYSDSDVVPITSADVASLQTLYDEMITLRNHIFLAYQSEVGPVVMEVIDPTETAVPEPEPEHTGPSWSFTTDDYEDVTENSSKLENYRAEVESELRAFLEEHGAKRIDGRLAKSIAEATSIEEVDRIKHNILNSPEFQTPEVSSENAELMAKFEAIKTDIAEEAESISQSKDILFARFPKASRTEDVQSRLDILDAFVKRANLIKEKTESLDEQDVSVVQSTLEKYLKNIQQISKDSEHFIEGLSNEEAGMPELDEPEQEVDVPSAEQPESKEEAVAVIETEAEKSEVVDEKLSIEDAVKNESLTGAKGAVIAEAEDIRKIAHELRGRFSDSTPSSDEQKILDIVSGYVEYTENIKRKSTDESSETVLADYLEKLEKVSSGVIRMEERLVSIAEEQKVQSEKQLNGAENANPRTESSSSLSPEKRVKTALDLAYQNMFLSATEMETVKAFARQIERQKTEGADEQKIAVTIEGLENLVKDFTEYPSVDYIPERMTKALQHAENAPAEMRQTAKAMSEVVARLLAERTAGKEISDERIAQAYKNLESFVNDHEGQWLTVCGMQVPKAGPEGVFGARSFREGLLVARDRHPELRRSLSKQLFLDDIVRMLQTVPSSGLTQEQADKIARLAREIDISTRIVEARQAESAKVEVASVAQKEAVSPVVKPQGSSVRIETSAETAEAVVRKNAKLEIRSEDPAESVIEIDVAKMAQAIIEEENPAPAAVFNTIQAPSTRPVVAEMEKIDPINKIVPDKMPEIRAQEKIDPNSLTRKYLNSTRYSEFLAEHYSSPEAFEKILKIEKDAFDSQKRDQMAEYFGEKKASAFDFLKAMKLEDLKKFQQKGYEEKVALLREQNVSYDSVVVWLDLINPMAEVVGQNPDMHLGELFARWMIETEMSYYEGGTSASQFTL